MTKRILVIDDEERIREVVRACLEDLAGWIVFSTGSGQQGLEQAKAESVDAILLDISMPQMDGFTFLQHLQSDPALRSIPVILLTAKVQPMDKNQFSAMAIAGVISKPFDPMSFAEEIANILGWPD
ncbi:response regulator [Egbenema bharatensis]|uniref:response regulator n=1 Tax=Egbenema bharatensis TaxID=3463334 RepID=UPI003A8A6399